MSLDHIWEPWRLAVSRTRSLDRVSFRWGCMWTNGEDICADDNKDECPGMAYLDRQLQQVIGRILSGQWRASRMCLWWMQTPTFGDWSQRPPGGLDQTALSPHLDLDWFLRRRLLKHVAATLEALHLCAACRHQNTFLSTVSLNPPCIAAKLWSESYG